MNFDIHDLRIYQQLFNQAPIGILQSRLDGTILNVNHALARMLGYESREDYLCSVKNDVHNSYIEIKDRKALVDRVLSQKIPQAFETGIRSKGGTHLSCRVHMRVALHADGTVNYLESFIQDWSREAETTRQLKKGNRSTEAFSKTRVPGPLSLKRIPPSPWPIRLLSGCSMIPGKKLKAK